MAKRSPKKRHNHGFWLGMLAIGVVCLYVISCVSSQENVNARYGRVFEGRAKGKAGSYSSPGLRESDIQKRQGRNYQTY